MSAIVFTGKQGVTTYSAIALKHGLKMWRDLKMKPNRAWTPTAMMHEARRITGETFASHDYTGAIKALEIWINRYGSAS